MTTLMLTAQIAIIVLIPLMAAAAILFAIQENKRVKASETPENLNRRDAVIQLAISKAISHKNITKTSVKF